MAKKSKVVSSVEGDSWAGSDGEPMCTFTIEMEDGVKGEYYIPEKYKAKMPFTVGRELEYETSLTAKGKTKIKYVKPPSNYNRSGGQSTYNDPVGNKKIAMSVCQDAAEEALIALDYFSMKNVTLVAAYFHKWVVKHDDKRDNLSLRWYAILRASRVVKTYFSEKIDTEERANIELEKIIKNAEIFYDQIDAIKE